MPFPGSKTARWLEGRLWARELGLHLGAVALCLIFLTGALRLWRADLRVPFAYTGDALATQMQIKGVVENGWYLHNDRLGAPGAAELYGYPQADNLHFLCLKALAWAAPDSAAVFNLFFLLPFPLTVVTTLLVLRHFKIGPGPAVVGSLLFTFLPYHFLKGERGHLFHAACYPVPLALMVLLWVYLDHGPFFRWDEANGRSHMRLWTARSLVAVVVALLVASTGVYYAFFACALLPVAGLAASLRRKRAYPFANAAVLLTVVGLGVLANLAPNLIYQHQHPDAWRSVVRTPQQGEAYGLKLIQLLLPVAGHRLPWLAALRASYDETALRGNDSGYSSLGAVGALGFLAVMGWSLFRRKPGEGSALYDALGLFTLCSVLLATVGGFGSVLSYSFAPWIRVYSRISVFLGLFSLFAVVLFLDGLRRRFGGAGVKAWVFHGLLAALLVGGILDQASPAVIPPYASLREEYGRDADFVRAVEGVVPPDTLIFQLPHVPFPEHPPVNRMKDYDLFRGYLHSRNLRWSYGALRDQAVSAWLDDVAARPTAELTPVLSLAGFGGVWVDRAGFADSGAAVEGSLAGALATQPLVSADGRFAFYSMEGFNGRFRAQFTEEQWQAQRRRALLPPVQLTWEGGFCLPEGGPEVWRWGAEEGELTVANPSDQDRRVVLEMHLQTGRAEPSGLRLRGDLVSADLTVADRDVAFSQTLVVPPGRHSIHFACDGRRLDPTPTDPRVRVFRVGNVSLRDAD